MFQKMTEINITMIGYGIKSRTTFSIDVTCWMICVLSLGYVFINRKNNRGIWFA